MIHYCGKYSSQDAVFTKLMNKYQRDIINPFVEAINYNSLDVSKFSTPLDKKLININALRGNPVFLEEFDLLTWQNFKLFVSPNNHYMTGGHNIRFYLRGKVEKFFVRRVREYLKDRGISAPELDGYSKVIYDLAILAYVNKGRISSTWTFGVNQYQ